MAGTKNHSMMNLNDVIEAIFDNVMAEEEYMGICNQVINQL